MTDHFKDIYHNHAGKYDRMVAREDFRGNLFSALNEIQSPYGQIVMEAGAGTGRVTRLMSIMARRIYAFDIAPPMLKVAKKMLHMTGTTNWQLAAADNCAVPLANNSTDMAVQGWSFGHAVDWYPHTWQTEVGQMLAELQRIVRPGGTIILMETLGTGIKQPAPPTPGHADLYRWWEQAHGFHHRWIRTDYQFASVDEADELTRFFFGNELADKIRAENLTILPECTGIWWKTKR